MNAATGNSDPHANSSDSAHTSNDNRAVFIAAQSLDIRPRSGRWRSVSYCVLDAVWSIGARYDSVVGPLVRKVAAHCGDSSPLSNDLDSADADPLPLTRLLECFPTVEALHRMTNSQLTSSRSGILKADAALRYANALVEADVSTLADAQGALRSGAATEISSRLRRIPGRGVREGYFWMLVGDDDMVKPDRHVLKWLADNGLVTDDEGARSALAQIAAELTASRGVMVTPWEVDNAVWRHQTGSQANY